MLSKEEHITYWVNQAEKEAPLVKVAYLMELFGASLFWLHLTFERYCKAIWIKNNLADTPPRTHNLLTILRQSNIEIEEIILTFIIKMNRYQIEGRYPEYVETLDYSIGQEEATIILEESKQFKEWLLKKLE